MSLSVPWWNMVEARLSWRFVREPGFDSLAADTPYIMTPLTFDALLRQQAVWGREVIVAHQPATLPAWRPGEALDGARVAIHHTGALGDELVMTAFYNALRWHHPGVDLHAITHGSNHFALYGNAAVGMRARGGRDLIPRAEAERFDRWLAPAPVGWLQRGTPHNIYDLLTEEIGVAPRLARPSVRFTEGETDEHRGFFSELPPEFWHRMIVVQINASEPGRTVPPAVLAGHLGALLARLRGERWFVALVGEEKDMAALSLAMNGTPIPAGIDIIPIARSPYPMVPHATARALLYLTSRARLVIAPDSFLLHAAAAFDTPTLALWSPHAGSAVEPEEDAPLWWGDRAAVAEYLTRRVGVENPYLPEGVGLHTPRPIPLPSSRLDTYTSASHVTWDVEPEVVGEIARMLLY